MDYNQNVKADIEEAKVIEYKVLELLKCDGFVTSGNFEYDIVINKNGQTKTIEVKYHRQPQKFIPLEIVNLYHFVANGILTTRVDYWINVVSIGDKKEVWFSSLKKLKTDISVLLKTKEAIIRVGGDNNNMILVLLPLTALSSFAEKIGEI